MITIVNKQMDTPPHFPNFKVDSEVRSMVLGFSETLGIKN